MKETLRKKLESKLVEYQKRLKRYKENQKLSGETGHYYNAFMMQNKIVNLEGVVADLKEILK